MFIKNKLKRHFKYKITKQTDYVGEFIEILLNRPIEKELNEKKNK